jgi:hypothetical protein
MNFITVKDIMKDLQVTDKEVAMAIYSGRIPRPNDEGGWYKQDIVIYLNLWERGLVSKRKQVADRVSKFSFPSHQR